MNSVRTLDGKKNAKNYVLKPFNFFKHSILCAKCPERILDNVAKPFNKPYTALKCMRIQIYFSKIPAVRPWNPPAMQYSRYGLNLADSALLPSWCIPRPYS